MKGSWLKSAFKLAISVAIIALLVSQVNPKYLKEAMKSVSLGFLTYGVLLYLLTQVLSAWRWLNIAASMKLKGSLVQYYRLYLLGMFFNLFLPTAVGGDMGRAVILSKESACTFVRAFLSILAERGAGLIGLMYLADLGLFILKPEHWGYYATLLSLGAIIGSLSMIGFPWVERHAWGKALVERFVLKTNGSSDEDPGKIWPHNASLLRALLISLVFHIAAIFLQLLILNHLGVNLPFLLMGAIYGLSGLASMLPLSFNGIGLREGSTTLLLVHWGHLSRETATIYSLVWLSIILLSALPGGLILLKDQLVKLQHSYQKSKSSPAKS